MKKILIFVFLLEFIVANFSIVTAQDTLPLTIDEGDVSFKKHKNIVIIIKSVEKEKTKSIIF